MTGVCQEKQKTLLTEFVEMLIPKEAKPKEALDSEAEIPKEASEAEITLLSRKF